MSRSAHYKRLLAELPAVYLDSRAVVNTGEFIEIANAIYTWRDVYAARAFFHGLMERLG
jgi:hypothetical protein